MTVFEAKRPGRCAICGRDYPIGTRITKDKGSYSEADCKWPQHKKDDAAQTGEGGRKAGAEKGRLGGTAPADAEAGRKKEEAGLVYSPASPPSPITDKQIDEAWKWAVDQTGGSLEDKTDDMRNFEITMRYFDAKLAQLTQRFWIDYTKWEHALKSSRIKEVKGG